MNSSSFRVETPDESSGFLLWQITTLWQREIKATLETLELSHSGFVILASLLWFRERKDEVTQTTVIEHSKLDKMTVSKSLKTLLQKDLVTRAEHSFDTRAKTIALTRTGISLAVKAVKTVENVDEKFFSKLEKEERELLNSLFIKLK